MAQGGIIFISNNYNCSVYTSSSQSTYKQVHCSPSSRNKCNNTSSHGLASHVSSDPAFFSLQPTSALSIASSHLFSSLQPGRRSHLFTETVLAKNCEWLPFSSIQWPQQASSHLTLHHDLISVTYTDPGSGHLFQPPQLPVLLTPCCLGFLPTSWAATSVLFAASSFFVNPLKCQHFSESHPQYSRLKLLQTPVTMCMLWLSNIVQAWMALLSSRPTYLISMVTFRWISAASSNSGCSKLNSSLIIQIYFSI